MTRPYFKALRRGLDISLLTGRGLDGDVRDILFEIEQTLIRSGDRDGGTIARVLPQFEQMAEILDRTSEIPGDTIRDLASLDPFEDFQSLLDEVFGMMGYYSACVEAERAFGERDWYAFSEKRLVDIRANHGDRHDLIAQAQHWVKYVIENAEKLGSGAPDRFLAPGGLLTEDFDTGLPNYSDMIAFFPLSIMKRAFVRASYDRNKLLHLLDVASRGVADDVDGDVQAKIVDPIMARIIDRMTESREVLANDEPVQAMQNLVQFLITETKDFSSHVPLLKTYWRQAIDSNPPDFSPFEKSENAATLLWTAAVHNNLERKWSDWAVSTGRPFLNEIDAYLEAEQKAGDSDTDSDRGFDRVRIAIGTAYRIDHAFRADSPDKAHEVIDRLDVPKNVREALYRVVAFKQRVDGAEHFGFARIFDSLRNDENYFFIDAAEGAKDLMINDIARLFELGEREKLKEIKKFLSNASGTHGTLKQEIDEFMPKWSALSAGHEHWGHLTRDRDLVMLRESILYAAEQKANFAIKALELIAPILIHVYRRADDAIYLESPANGVIDIRNEMSYCADRQSVAEMSRIWPDFKDKIDVIVADKELLELFLAEFNTLFAYVDASMKGAVALDGLDRIVMHVGECCAEYLHRNFDDPQHARFLATGAAAADRLSGWIYRLGTLTGIGASTVEVVLSEVREWPSDYRATFDDLHQDTWPQIADAMANVTSIRQHAAALRARMRTRQLETLAGRARVKGEAAKPVLHDPAALQAIYVLQDEIRTLVSPPQLESEWYSTRARSWSHLVERPSNAGMLAELASFFEELKITWNEGTDEFRENLRSSPKHIKNHTINAALSVLSLVDGEVIAYLMEAIPDMQLMLRGGLRMPQVAPGFLESHTLDFKLHNEAGNSELSSLVAHNMVLELINMTNQSIILDDPVAPPEEPDGPPCHFILRFRRGTLMDDLANIGLEGPPGNWNIVGFATRPKDHPEYDELYIVGPKDHKILTGQSRHLMLTQMQGAEFENRNTRVLILHQGLKSEIGPLDVGRRERRISVVHTVPTMRAEASVLPIFAGFVASNSVLNDGENPSVIQIDMTSMVANERQPPIRFWNIGQPKPGADGASKDFWSRSKIILSIDTQDDVVKDDKSWALCTKAQAVAIQPKLMRKREFVDENNNITPAQGVWDSTFTSLGARASWVFTPPRGATDGDLRLDRGKSLKLDLDRIRTELPNGLANLYIRVENVPGYPDREYILKVRKSPIYERGGRLGIGTTNPQSDLDVAGDVKAAGVVNATLPAGVVMPFAGNHLPPGWLFCDGQPIPQETAFESLRTLLAAATGQGLDQQEVCTPNLIGRVVLGAAPTESEKIHVFNRDAQINNGAAAFPEPDEVCLDVHSTGGKWQHQLSDAEMPTHGHDIPDKKTHGFEHNRKTVPFLFGSQLDIPIAGTTLTHFAAPVPDNYGTGTAEEIWENPKKFTRATETHGGNLAHTNVQPYHVLQYIIKY